MRMQPTPRVRVFAGPNGSGKSTLLAKLAATVPMYAVINPDDIERSMNTGGGVALMPYGVTTNRSEFLAYVGTTSYPERVKLAASQIIFDKGKLRTKPACESSYNAAVVAAFLRSRLVAKRMSFSFESVFSHQSKLDELRDAQSCGYRIYLYYIAMDAPELCAGRVAERKERGGHDVPEHKIARRYTESLENLMPALSLAYRAYIFDNSGREAVLLAEKTPRGNLKLAQEQVPTWFEQHVLRTLQASPRTERRS